MDIKSFAGKFLSRLDKIDTKQIEAYFSKLIQEKNFLEIILNRLREGIIVTDTAFQILFMNRASCRVLGLKGSPQQFLGKNLPDITDYPDLKARLLQYNPFSGEVVTEELRLKKTGQQVFLARLLPLPNDEGGVESIVILLSDITEQKKSDEVRIKSQRLSALATLTAGVAHEIKNPLNSLQIHAQLLRKYLTMPPEEMTPEYRQRSLRSNDIILEEIARLSRIVNQFLMAVTPRRLEMQSGNPNEVIRRALEVMAPTLAENGIKVTLNLEPTDVEVRLNAPRLTQAFLNIIKNAQEAMEETSEPSLVITSRIEGKSLAIDFIDNGCGITEKNLEKIFEPYFTTKFYGSGLGLMVVYQILSEHEGAISIKSTEGKGTTVTILLPISRQPIRLLADK